MCALCQQPRCAVEHLSDGWLFCARLGFRYRANRKGEVLSVAETQHSSPRKFPVDPRPIVAYAQPRKRT